MILILFGFALIVLIDLTPIIRRRSGRAAVAFLLLFAAALVLSVLQANSVEVPSVMLLLGDALKALGLSY